MIRIVPRGTWCAIMTGLHTLERVTPDRAEERLKYWQEWFGKEKCNPDPVNATYAN